MSTHNYFLGLNPDKSISQIAKFIQEAINLANSLVKNEKIEYEDLTPSEIVTIAVTALERFSAADLESLAPSLEDPKYSLLAKTAEKIAVDQATTTPIVNEEECECDVKFKAMAAEVLKKKDPNDPEVIATLKIQKEAEAAFFAPIMKNPDAILPESTVTNVVSVDEVVSDKQ